jgi:hypothetical protein
MTPTIGSRHSTPMASSATTPRFHVKSRVTGGQAHAALDTASNHSSSRLRGITTSFSAIYPATVDGCRIVSGIMTALALFRRVPVRSVTSACETRVLFTTMDVHVCDLPKRVYNPQ